MCEAWHGKDGTSQTYFNGQVLLATALSPGKLCSCDKCSCSTTVTVGNDADGAGCVANDRTQGFVGMCCS